MNPEAMLSTELVIEHELTAAIHVRPPRQGEAISTVPCSPEYVAA